MDHESTPERLAGTLQHLSRHWESRRRPGGASGRRALTIAVSREAGTQGTAIAREAGRLLGWHVYDHELLECIAKDMGLRTHLLESVDERNHSWILETTEAFLSAPLKSDWGPLVTESGFVHHLVKIVLALGVHGECVIVGRGAPFILPPATTLRVRLAAPVPDRIATLRKNLVIPEREAARQVRTLDRERTDFVLDHFFRNPDDPHNYDLVLNVARLSVPQSAEIVVETLHRLQARAAEKRADEASEKSFL
jgi:cytidylate kinase